MRGVREETLTTSDGLELHCRSDPGESPRALLLFVHGLAEHVARLDATSAAMGERGFSTFRFDVRGHGASGGRRHHVPHFSRYLDDLDLVLAHLDSLAPSLPRFVVGHSAGGLIALAHALERAPRLAGLVLVSPALAFAVAPSWPLRIAARLLNLLAPTFPIDSSIPLDRVSRNPEVERILRAENPRGIRVTPRWYFACRDAQRQVARRARELTIPLLTLAAGDDALVDSEAARRVHIASGAPAEDFVLWPECRHALFEEPNRDEIRERIGAWIEASEYRVRHFLPSARRARMEESV